ncbi:NAD(P)H-binding protein [Corynebacterium sp. A21]|uniref:NAD(P)H-binding protein n=1 Tax=Corynebacterium sp. A21 TaxID=3457318 RepID=UPI003FD2BD93
MKNALIVGGNETVARLTTPKLLAGGFSVTSVIRDKDRVGEILELGASPVIQDIARADVNTWRTLLSGIQLAIWSVGESAESSPEAEYDAAIQLIDTIGSSPNPPRLLLLSATAHTAAEAAADPDLAELLAARRAVDAYFCARALEDALLIGPGNFHDDAHCGIRLIDAAATPAKFDYPGSTSRELVSQVLAEMACREDLPLRGRLDFIDGQGNVEVL